ncbi:MAG: glycosyltransferase [Holosporales bacterium]|jgi:glycosyltransferase involved in cell wall biosynthesis|nr:glycosyltransferase [Holosporales bacterium]
MRIALVILTLRAGGAERDISRVANFLAQKHVVTLITLISTPEERPFYPLDPAIKFLPLKLSSYRRVLKHLKFDLIISYLTKANILTLLATRGLKIPVIISKRVDARLLPYGWFIKALRAWTYRWAALIVTQTEGIAATVKALGVPVMVIPNAVEVPPRQVYYAEQVTTLVSIGRLDAQKDFPTLLTAFSLVHKKAPLCSLHIYGEGSEKEDLLALVARLGIETQVRFFGITHDPFRVLSEADIFVSSTRYEGFPNALAEAMSVGLPVITSDRPENRELVCDEQNGRLFPIGKADRLAAVIEELLRDAPQRKRLGQEATKITIRFSPQRNHALWNEAIERATIRGRHWSK